MLIIEIQIMTRSTTHKDIKDKLAVLYDKLEDLLDNQEANSDDHLTYERSGLPMLSCNFLNQYLLFLMGLLYHLCPPDSQEHHLLTAKSYYLQSFQWRQLSHLDPSLYKRALKQLKFLHIEYAVPVDVLIVHRHLRKFYVKTRSVQVIMEMCNEISQVHKVLIRFVQQKIFAKLSPQDYFSFITLRSGKKPF